LYLPTAAARRATGSSQAKSTAQLLLPPPQIDDMAQEISNSE
jgi:hypothetical protein